MQYSIVVHDSGDYYIQTIYLLDTNRGIHGLIEVLLSLLEELILTNVFEPATEAIRWFGLILKFTFFPYIRVTTTKCASSSDSIYSCVPLIFFNFIFYYYFFLYVILLVSSCVIDAKKKNKYNRHLENFIRLFSRSPFIPDPSYSVNKAANNSVIRYLRRAINGRPCRSL